MGAVWMMGSVFLMFGLFSFMFSPQMHFLYCLFGVILFGFYLLIDTQLICGGGRVQVSPEHYILAVIMLYLDIINLFLYILMLFGGRE